MDSRSKVLLAPLLAVCVLVSSQSVGAEAVDFVRDVQPILAEHCHECHGPDKRKGGLRLSTRDEAMAPGESGLPVIVPGEPDASILVDLIVSDDAEERMPRDAPALSAPEIETLKRWIEQGATWPAAAAPPPHWAYQRPIRPSPPEKLSGADWARGPIDRFVLRNLEENGVRPAAEASPAVLLRRLHLDLTGLPPTPERVARFLASPTESAYREEVEHLLGSERFGERWASTWLDLARYADTTGFRSERFLPNWPYRDWVIDAINHDLPFDDFTVHQLAGDLLPNPSVEQKVATGFLRASPLNVEAGVHEEDARVTQVVDRVNVLGTAWLGTTVECAQCHNHEYDPFSQREYYELFAFLNQTTKETETIGNGPSSVGLRPAGPTLPLPPLERTREAARAVARDLMGEIDRVAAKELAGASALGRSERREIVQAAGEVDPERVAALASGAVLRRVEEERGGAWWRPWYQSVQKQLRDGAPHWRTLGVQKFAPNDKGLDDWKEGYRILDDGSVLLDGPFPGVSKYVADLEVGTAPVSALRVDFLRNPETPNGGPGRGPFPIAMFAVSEIRVLRIDAREDPTGLVSAREVPIDRAVSSFFIGPEKVLDRDPSTHWKVVTPKALERGHWLTLLLARPIELGPQERLRIEVEQNLLASTVGNIAYRATSDSRTLVGMSESFQATLRDTPIGRLDEMNRNLVKTIARESAVPALVPVFDEARERFARLPAPPRALVVERVAEERRTHLMPRGDRRRAGPEVEASTPAALHRMDRSLPRNRLGLARWLTDESNPLTARVTVNRWWAQLFGRGLVETLGDFGRRGAEPTHPELLDWLATELVAAGWSRKHVVREIVLSSTYRQSSEPAEPGLLERDPGNALLARNPRQRLPAELIRDNALAIAGLLSNELEGVAYPPQPEGIWPDATEPELQYHESRGAERYRRGIYTVWRRGAPYPGFMVFDAVDRTACVTERHRSNTPLQALALLNDDVFAEAALGFAHRLLTERPDADARARIEHAYRLALSRAPRPEEMRILQSLLDADHGSNAQELVGAVARFAVDESVSPADLARWFPVARTILNLDETITRG